MQFVGSAQQKLTCRASHGQAVRQKRSFVFVPLYYLPELQPQLCFEGARATWEKTELISVRLGVPPTTPPRHVSPLTRVLVLATEAAAAAGEGGARPEAKGESAAAEGEALRPLRARAARARRRNRLHRRHDG